MKRHFFACAIGLLFLAADLAQASPEQDAELIADRFVTDEWRDTVRQTVLAGHARALAQALAGRNVRVKDLDRLAAHMPPHLADDAVADLRQDTIDDILTRFDPEKVAVVAEYLRKYPGQRPYGDDVQQSAETPLTPDEWASAVSQTLADEDFESEMKLTVFLTTLFLRQMMELSDVAPDLSQPYVPDLLEAESDLFHFPNRIWRNDLIRELRQAKS